MDLSQMYPQGLSWKEGDLLHYLMILAIQIHIFMKTTSIFLHEEKFELLTDSF